MSLEIAPIPADSKSFAPFGHHLLPTQASFLCLTFKDYAFLYQELWPAVRVNETDTFADEDGANDEYFDFEDISGMFLSPVFKFVMMSLSNADARLLYTN